MFINIAHGFLSWFNRLKTSNFLLKGGLDRAMSQTLGSYLKKSSPVLIWEQTYLNFNFRQRYANSLYSVSNGNQIIGLLSLSLSLFFYTV